MPDRKQPVPDPDGTLDPRAPKPEKDDQRTRDTGRPMHPDEREGQKER